MTTHIAIMVDDTKAWYILQACLVYVLQPDPLSNPAAKFKWEESDTIANSPLGFVKFVAVVIYLTFLRSYLVNYLRIATCGDASILYITWRTHVNTYICIRSILLKFSKVRGQNHPRTNEKFGSIRSDVQTETTRANNEGSLWNVSSSNSIPSHGSMFMNHVLFKEMHSGVNDQQLQIARYYVLHNCFPDLHRQIYSMHQLWCKHHTFLLRTCIPSKCLKDVKKSI